jgi:hypothetical protein
VNKILLLIVAAFLLSGCGLISGPASAILVDSGPDFVDLSASESVATIRSQSHYGPFWTVNCWIEKPAKAKMLKIDAGVAEILTMCRIDFDGGVGSDSALFCFTAIVGHEYRVHRRMRPDANIELVDDTDNIVMDVNARRGCEHGTIPPAERVEVEVSADIFETYVGDYQLGPNFILTITVEDGAIWGQMTGQSNLQIFPESETEFFYEVADAQITFEVDDLGKITGLVVNHGGADVWAPKL